MYDLEPRLFILLGALILDAMIGDPAWLWRRVLHPVALIGRGIEFIDERYNRVTYSDQRRKQLGIVLGVGLVVLGGLIGLILSSVFSFTRYGAFLEALLVTVLIAQKSLYLHVEEVMRALDRDGVGAGRLAVSRIVGRETQRLDESGVARAAIESLAENFSDGIVGPVFFYLVAGLPGLLIYKAVNTADSMVGHKSGKYRSFGWASAKSDDILNFLPARISGLLIAMSAGLGGGRFFDSLKIMLADAGKHASPNAGWPEAAMSGALNISLGGPRSYSDALTADPWLNEHGRKQIGSPEISKALFLFLIACGLQLALVFALCAFVYAP